MTVSPERSGETQGLLEHEDADRLHHVRGHGHERLARLRLAADAHNAGRLSEGILPRYQSDADRHVEDPAKLAADERR